MLALAPFALRLLKAILTAAEDGLAGIQQLAHDTNLLFYGSEEAQEGRTAYAEKRKTDFGKFPKRPGRRGREAPVARRGAPADAAGRGRARARGHRARGPGGYVQAAALRRRADRLDLHPDRDEPSAALLRRAPRRRHRGPPRPRPRHGGGADAATAGADRHLRRVRR